MTFSFKVAALRWLYGFMVPSSPLLLAGAATGAVDWHSFLLLGLGGFTGAFMTDIHAFLKAKGALPTENI